MKERNKAIRIAVLFLAAIVLVCGLGANVTYAETPYKTYTVDGYDTVQETQTAYLAYTTLIKFGDESFSGASDMCLSQDGTEIYVADTGNARVLVGDLNGNLIKIIGEGILSSPRCVYVTEDGNIYVGDYNLKEVVVFDSEGTVIAEYGKPDSPLYGDSYDFLPLHIVVNDSGVMYIICEANTNGVVEISPTEGGTFLGYFGTNYTSTSLMQVFYRMILTDEQRANMVSNLPAAPKNLAIDEKGLIYTVTAGDGGTSIKRLNIAGTNLLGEVQYTDTPAAAAAGNYDNVYVADQNGYILEYTNEGDLLFVFGGRDDDTNRIGLSTNLVAIDVDKEDRIYVLDTDKNQIQVYEPTEFTNLLHSALNLYSNGKYKDSQEPLEEVLKMNSMFAYANRAMGRAYYQLDDYENALTYAKLSNDREGYSNAYWEVRNTWLKNNLVEAVLIIVAIFIIWEVLKFADKKKGIYDPIRHGWSKCKENKTVNNFCYAKYYMMHPIDGSYGIAREGRGAWIAPSIVLALFTAEFVIDKYLCGFLQKTVREGRYEIGRDIGIIVVVIFAVTVCNYLVCTISEGEGTPKKIYTYFCYSLLPYVCLTPIKFALSHCLTENEQFLITVVVVIMYVWVAVLIVIGMKEVNNFTGGETAKILFLTVFTILIAALLLFIVYVLWAQVFEFISALFGEVVYRLG